MSGDWREKREPGAIWGGWWFWEPQTGKTKEAQPENVDKYYPIATRSAENPIKQPRNAIES